MKLVFDNNSICHDIFVTPEGEPELSVYEGHRFEFINGLMMAYLTFGHRLAENAARLCLQEIQSLHPEWLEKAISTWSPRQQENIRRGIKELS